MLHMFFPAFLYFHYFVVAFPLVLLNLSLRFTSKKFNILFSFVRIFHFLPIGTHSDELFYQNIRVAFNNSEWPTFATAHLIFENILYICRFAGA